MATIVHGSIRENSLGKQAVELRSKQMTDGPLRACSSATGHIERNASHVQRPDAILRPTTEPRKSPSGVYFRTCPRDYECLTQALTTDLRVGIGKTCRDDSHSALSSSQIRHDMTTLRVRRTVRLGRWRDQVYGYSGCGEPYISTAGAP